MKTRRFYNQGTMKIYQSIKIISMKSVVATIMFTVLLNITGCSDDPGDNILGEKYIENDTQLTLVDTFSVKLSTVKLDTIDTNQRTKLYVGKFYDNYTGYCTSRSYFQIGIPTNKYIDEDEVYDSLTLVIKYDGSSYGDTTKVQNLYVHQLTEEIEFSDDEYITSNTEFDFNENPIGELSFLPRPHSSTDSISIPITDEIGIDLFDKLKENDDIFINDERFINYFFGLMLKSDEAEDGAIIGFNGDKTDVKIVMHTTLTSEINEEKKYLFYLSDIRKQYNRIISDYSETELSSLVEQETELNSDETSGLSYIKGGTGFAIRVDFPSLDELLLYDQINIVSAELLIAPKKNSYDDLELPADVVVNCIDKKNRITVEQSAFTTSLKIDDLYTDNTGYVFDVTDYINDELEDSYIDKEKGLLLSFNSSKYGSSFGRLPADAKNKNTKLKIYYLTN